MSDNIIPFSIPEKKQDLDSSEIKSMIKKIAELAQCKGMVILALGNNGDLTTVRTGNLTTSEMIYMCSYGSYKGFEEIFEGEGD